jgi:hypothetical protein
MSRIHVVQTFDVHQMIFALESAQSNADLKLVIVDSVGGGLTPVMSGSQRSRGFMQSIQHSLGFLAKKRNLHVIYTNTAVLDRDTSHQIKPGGYLRAALGRHWATLSDRQIFLSHPLGAHRLGRQVESTTRFVDVRKCHRGVRLDSTACTDITPEVERTRARRNRTVRTVAYA